MSQDGIITLFALISCTISLITWLVILYLEVRNPDRNYWIVFYVTLSILVTAWFSGGFFLIETGIPVSTETYFRPLLPVLVALFTAGGVFVYHARLQHITITRQQVIIEQMRERMDELARVESA